MKSTENKKPLKLIKVRSARLKMDYLEPKCDPVGSWHESYIWNGSWGPQKRKDKVECSLDEGLKENFILDCSTTNIRSVRQSRKKSLMGSNTKVRKRQVVTNKLSRQHITSQALILEPKSTKGEMEELLARVKMMEMKEESYKQQMKRLAAITNEMQGKIDQLEGEKAQMCRKIIKKQLSQISQNVGVCIKGEKQARESQCSKTAYMRQKYDDCIRIISMQESEISSLKRKCFQLSNSSP